MEVGHWQVNGINLLVKDFIQQDGMEKGQPMRLYILDAFVEAEETEPFLGMMTAHLTKEGALTFKRGSRSFDARFDEFIYSVGKRGCTMRLAIRLQATPSAEKPDAIEPRTAYLQMKDDAKHEAIDRLAGFAQLEHLVDSDTAKSARNNEREKKVDVFMEVDDVETFLSETGRALKQIRNHSN